MSRAAMTASKPLDLVYGIHDTINIVPQLRTRHLAEAVRSLAFYLLPAVSTSDSDPSGFSRELAALLSIRALFLLPPLDGCNTLNEQLMAQTLNFFTGARGTGMLLRAYTAGAPGAFDMLTARALALEAALAWHAEHCGPEATRELADNVLDTVYFLWPSAHFYEVSIAARLTAAAVIAAPSLWPRAWRHFAQAMSQLHTMPPEVLRWISTAIATVPPNAPGWTPDDMGAGVSLVSVGLLLGDKPEETLARESSVSALPALFAVHGPAQLC